MRRIGRFKLDCRLIDKEPEVCKSILSGLIIVEAEAHYHNDTIEYVALGDVFEEVDQHSVVPDYTVIVTTTEYGDEISFVKDQP